ncbi:unnamed protein product [Musa acuminata subsp. malaccensis]|uniref:(wild Malaysian banana) hypothetical protein n=1 Tax=Musa acuminata subsp. malaccensis TaxID=214687 RepID=A0A804IN65_MUSAM|nr:PREDICTED: uncharacterized protein LOC103981098 [Musa acuminata subsp. malaccensis]CAG1841759.1 unnamed protein product [Musa acuminata subsp. malaccensis]
MKESGGLEQRRRRRRWFCCVLCILILVLLVVTAVVLALTVFKIREPTGELVSVTVSGVSPRVDLPALRVELNVTLDLAVRVHNRNYAAFTHAPGGRTSLLYRGTQVGEADVAPGRIPSRGSELLQLALAVEVDRIVAELGSLLSDVVAGAVAFDTVTRLPGRVTFMGFIKRHAVATSDCHVVIGVSDLSVRSQDCTYKTNL